MKNLPMVNLFLTRGEDNSGFGCCRPAITPVEFFEPGWYSPQPDTPEKHTLLLLSSDFGGIEWYTAFWDYLRYWPWPGS
jgi:hypothetical protein